METFEEKLTACREQLESLRILAVNYPALVEHGSPHIGASQSAVHIWTWRYSKGFKAVEFCAQFKELQWTVRGTGTNREYVGQIYGIEIFVSDPDLVGVNGPLLLFPDATVTEPQPA